MTTIDRKTIRKAKRRDRVARSVIVLGGVTVIAGVVAILLLIAGVTLPLFRPARSQLLIDTRLPSLIPPDRVVAVGVDLSLGEEAIRSLTADVLSSDGTLAFLDMTAAVEAGAGTSSDASSERSPAESGIFILGQENIAGASHDENRTVRFVERHAGSRISVLWSDGSTSLVEVSAEAEFDQQGGRRSVYTINRLAAMPAEKGDPPELALMRFFDDREEGSKTVTCARALPGGRISVVRELTVEDDLLGTEETTTHRTMVEEGISAPIGAMTMDATGSTLYVGTTNGYLAWWEFDEEGGVKRRDSVLAFRDRRAVTSLSLVLGDVSLAVGDEKGDLTTWLRVRFEPLDKGEATTLLRQVHRLSPHDGPVRSILPSQRNKSLVSLGDGGRANLDYVTSERHLLSIDAGATSQTVGYAHDGTAFARVDDRGQLAVWQIDCPHPEIGWSTLFGRIFYEGYPEPEHVWQTTGGEEFEPKFGLVPLLFGTLKGTFYAMLFAVPLALAAAAYTSHFTTPRFKAAIKPVVEIMAAVPSVVIGFLIALWLAPIVERGILAVFASLVTIPFCFVTFMAAWQLVRRFDWAKRLENGYEFIVLVPVIVVGCISAFWLAEPIETMLFDGNFKLWLFETLDMRYDQRNCIIIAFGLGFAVIPIIFSISEDSLSNVPYTLSAASMAMGASRWQTLWRIVLPSASPGIFAATMIGFGRAVGETMIVLMATGNTPILDASPFNGMRTLSANIAVEIPEAPVGGTLYRVLFLCAVLLFLLTFALNTIAEVVRHRLRKQYGRF